MALGYGEVRGSTTTTEIDYRATNVGASYNFGFVKPMVLIASERGNGCNVTGCEFGIRHSF